MLEFTLPPSTGGVGELERPQEVRCLHEVGTSTSRKSLEREGWLYLLEVGASRCNLVNEILDAKNVVFAEHALNDTIVGNGNPLLVDFAISTLVDELSDGLQVRFTGKRARVVSANQYGMLDDTHP
jgi:hypothetical protein